ncbi:MAG: LamG domain-containing protein, partial [Phycisphaerae bacterium]|nr:LamG domain-containing protein [Phycisphaerae bacterium]
MSSPVRFSLIGVLVCAGLDSAPRAEGAEPVRRDLVVFYDFQDAAGLIVRDRSGVGRPLDLKIDAQRGFERRPGAIRLDGSVRIRSAGPATKFIEAVKKSSALTIETWIRPRNGTQGGPARIVSLSIDPYQRNFTLGQEADHFDVRFRTSSTSDNGQPSTASPKGSARVARTHVVYTRDPKGSARLYVDGRQVAQAKVAGNLNNWRDDCSLILANEKTGDRPWLGELYQVAVYSAALSAEEVARNFAAGEGGKRPPVAVVPPVPPKPTTVPDPTSTGAKRVGRGLQVFYDFASPTGAVVRDRSGAGAPVHLRITEPKSVRRTAGALEVRGDTLIRSDQSATRLTEAIRRSARITLEAWIRPARTDLVGPARIVTLSADTSRRNFTLGQEADRYDVRFRAAGTSENGIPSLASPARSLAPKLTHLAYTRDRAGRARIYING